MKCKLLKQLQLFLKLISLFFLAVIPFSCNSAKAVGDTYEPVENRTVENFGGNWQFQQIDNFSERGLDWEEVNIPHTTRVEPLVVNDQWQGEAVYQKTFEVGGLDDTKWFFKFEGVMQEAHVSINDSLVLKHKGGYLPFTVDATPYLKEGSNRIEVEVLNVDNATIPPGKPLADLDFNMYGGIYRNVYLIRTRPLHITNAVRANVTNGGGVLVHFDSINKKTATGIVKTHVKNEDNKRRNVKLKISLFDEEGKVAEFSSSEMDLSPGAEIGIVKNIAVQDPRLWSPSSPDLYKVKVEVVSDGDVVDFKELKTGIRDIELTAEGFYLNGKKIFLNGTNRHQEYPYIGYALSDEAQYRDAYKIKQAGFNFVRLSHYPQSPAFLQAADELGLMVMNPIPGWQYFNQGEFAENVIQNIKDLVRRDRNHPSVVFWENSLNESQMTEEFIVRANQVLKAELPYEDTYSAGWIDHPAYDLFIPARQHAEPPFYWNRYNKLDRPIFIAEYGDWEYDAKNAGFNQDDFSDLPEDERSSRQLRSAGEQRLLQQVLNFQEAFNSNLKGDQIIGHANWLMFDYNRGYSPDLEASGIADIFRIPKFSYYFFKSQKAPSKGEFSEPMVFIASHWTPQSSPKIKVFSNAEEVALFLNGTLIERKKPEINEISDELPFPPFVFEIGTFRPGTIRAVGFIDDKEVASHVVRTPGEPFEIDLVMDQSGKAVSGKKSDVVFVYAIIRDKNGTAIPTATNQVFFSLKGAGNRARLIGENPVKAEAGIASILIKTNALDGYIEVEAEAAGLEEGELIIRPKK